MLLDYKTTKRRFRKTFLLCCVTICAKTGLSSFMSQVMNSFVEGHSQKVLLKYLPKESKLGQPSYFVIWLMFVTLWHTSKIFESSLNNLKLFFSMFANLDRIIWSFISEEKQVLERADCFLACPGSCCNEKMG